MDQAYDVLIVGGGIMGASIAYNLANDGFDGKIAVFEKDPTYEFASTCLSLAGVREQFTREISIKMSMYSIGIFEKFEEEMAVDGDPPSIELQQTGYLILADEQQLKELKKHHALQKKLGAQVEILTPEEIQDLVPELNVEGLAGGSIGRRDGQLDPYGLLQGYKKRGKSLGVEYIYEEVTGIFKKGNKITGLETAKGNRYSGHILVNAAGPWGAHIGKLLGVDLPIKPLRRLCYTIATKHAFNRNLPRIINGVGVSMRTEKGGNLILSRRKDDDQFGFDFTVDYDFFHTVIWPEMAERIPVLNTLKLMRGWSGLYSMCLHDSNDILGTHPEVEGLYLAIGFSGHGMQQAPAVGKGLSELIRLGRYETLDLSPFRFERFAENDLIPEEGIYAHTVFLTHQK